MGKGNYLTFLTADHGGVNNATFLQDQRIPAGIWYKKGLVDELNKSLKTKFNKVVYEGPTDSEQVIPYKSAFLMQQLLQGGMKEPGSS